VGGLKIMERDGGGSEHYHHAYMKRKNKINWKERGKNQKRGGKEEVYCVGGKKLQERPGMFIFCPICPIKDIPQSESKKKKGNLNWVYQGKKISDCGSGSQ